MKKMLKFVLGLLLVGSMVFADESAQVIISTVVGETTANSGIRVVESYTGITTTEFDTAFFSAGSVLPLATAITAASGGFVVMVRRPTSTTVTVSVSGTPMALVGGTGIVPTIPYTISGTESPDAVVYVNYISGGSTTPISYSANTVVGGILRDAKSFIYEIPEAESAPLGTYSATITFSITVG